MSLPGSRLFLRVKLRTKMQMMIAVVFAGFLISTAMWLRILNQINVSSGLQLEITITIAVSVVVFLFLVGASLVITSSVTDPLKQGVSFARSVSDGDFSESLIVWVDDEIGDLSNSLNNMAGSLQKIVGNVNKTVTELTKVTNTIAQASKQVHDAAQVQAEGGSQVSSAVTQINFSIKGVAEGVDSLAISAAGTSSSILEMAASVEEVALSVENLAQSVEEVSTSITEMIASIKQVGSGVISLMEASETTASSIREMDSSIKQVEKSAMQTAAISDEVRLDAETGKGAVDAVIAGMKEIKRSSRITSEAIETLSGRTMDIGDILSVIDEVAEQTNLLALNAAIIASQAGEHGKGFAVVADEIKELADRTSSSTREIAEVIRGVQDDTERVVNAVQLAEKSIAEGEILAQRSGDALTKVVAGVKQSTQQMAEIARATAEQSKGSQVIRDAMEVVYTMVEQIAKATKEQGIGGEMIMYSTERMKELTSQVKLVTREQSNVGNFIAKSTEDIIAMIRRIKQACDEQGRGSEQIVSAVVEFERSTQLNLDASKVLNRAVTNLAGQTSELQTEMKAFKI